MIIWCIIFFCAFMFIWEIEVFYKNKYIEDLLIAVACIGAVAFLLAMKLKGV